MVAKTQFDHDLRGAEFEEIPVRLGVVANGMAARNGFFHQVGTFADKAANQEERGLGLIVVQQVQQSRRDGGIRAIVKGHGQLAR